jgi:hypothetical protein
MAPGRLLCSAVPTWSDFGFVQSFHLKVFVCIVSMPTPVRLNWRGGAAAECTRQEPHGQQLSEYLPQTESGVNKPVQQLYAISQARTASLHFAQPDPQMCAAAQRQQTCSTLCQHASFASGEPAAHLTGPEPFQGSADGKSVPPALVLAPPALLPPDLMRYERLPGPGSADGGAGMGAAGLNGLLFRSLSFALLGVPGLLLLRVTTAMLSLVCARPPICRRSMRFYVLQAFQCSAPDQ